MNHLTTDLAQALVENRDIKEIFREHLEHAVNQLLRNELTCFLDYEPYDAKGINSGNSRNGYYSRKFNTEFGELSIQVPRDRNGSFEQQTVAPYKRNSDSLEEVVIHLYKKGVTTSEIADLMEKMYGHHYSKQTISNFTKMVEADIEAYKSSPLNKRYVCVYLDATHIPLRRKTVAKEAVYIAIGIDEDGHKEVLDFTIAPTESAMVWEELIQGLKARGLENVLLFISDGLSGMTDAIHRVYPYAKHQTCLVHIARNINGKARVSDREEIADDFKKIHQATNLESSQEALKAFEKKWRPSYKKLVDNLVQNNQLLVFLDFPECIQRSLYSTNLIEGFNAQIKRYTKRKEQFPNEESLERFLVSIFLDYNQKFAMRCHRGFKKAKPEIIEMFEEQLAKQQSTPSLTV